MSATAFPIGDTNLWAVSVDLTTLDSVNGFGSRQHEARGRGSPIALHFVIDNSGSMGRMTAEIRNIFSGLVDSAASRPCSLTLFSNQSTLLSSGITSSRQMKILPDVPQGGTNIPVGVRTAMEVITLVEKEEETKGVIEKTHHILILLTDGAHNQGRAPNVEFPLIGKECHNVIPNVQLSVVVVGITRNSSTSMGMLLKTSLETVPLDANSMKNIYFAVTQAEMKSVTKSLINGLNSLSTGIVYTLTQPCGNLVSGIGSGLTTAMKIRSTTEERRLAVLLEDKTAPTDLYIDGQKIELSVEDQDIDFEFIAELLRSQIDKVRIKRVASNDPSSIRSAVTQLGSIIDALEKQLTEKDGAKLKLSKATPHTRIAQHRNLIKTMHMARQLRNELADVASFTANSSEAQAAFLTGSKSKYASKALRRAAARTGNGMVLDPEKEKVRIQSKISSPAFSNNLMSLLRADILSHVMRLSKDQMKELEKSIKKRSDSDFGKLRQVVRSLHAISHPSMSDEDETTESIELHPQFTEVFEDMQPDIKNFIDSGTLAKYLNETFFGERRSYLSLSSPWEHLAEWSELSKDDTKFYSQWEMLLYVGSVGFPITVERSAATQMNPFQVAIKKVRTTMVDTASLCCANHSEIDTYGPEAGEPIKDALVLVDPSCPAASVEIMSSPLLGETYTSVVLSRDLHMYTGVSMKVALHAHALFRCLLPASADTKTKSEIVAEIQRQYMNRAYQCAECGFGPVDHAGCSDLFSHHEEVDHGGGVASNACPFCGWFSSSLDDWASWDGTVPEIFLSERMDTSQKSSTTETKALGTMMDMVLRILYSFRKMFQGRENPIRIWYGDLAKRMVEWDLRFTTQDEVDGLVQVLLAVMTCDDDIIGDENAIDAAFAPPVILALVNEACARAARKRFRMAAKGDDGEAKEMAARYVTKMLQITEESAPTTTESLMEPEPSRDLVEEKCSRHYDIDSDDSAPEWVTKLADRWCTALSFAKAFRTALVKRGGGWEKLEHDMETSLEQYADAVEGLQKTAIIPFPEMCDISMADMERTLATMAAQAFLYNKGSSRQDLPDVRCGETTKDIAREMRMRIYSRRVQEKMAQWSDKGEALAFSKARAADIGQYMDLLNIRCHVHGLSREMFWGLWEAAIHDGCNGEKVQAFLATANEPFHWKYASNGEVRGKRTKKNRQTQER